MFTVLIQSDVVVSTRDFTDLKDAQEYAASLTLLSNESVEIHDELSCIEEFK